MAKKSLAPTSSSPRALRTEFERGAQEVHVVHTRNLHRVLKAKEQTGGGTRLGFHREQIQPVKGGGTTDVVTLPPAESVCERALPRTIRAHDGVDLTGPDAEVESFEDQRSANRSGEILDLQHQPTLPSKLTLSRR